MKSAQFGWVVFGALVALVCCRVPSPEWNGTWKLNPTKSSYQGQVFTISISADGEYHYDFGKSGFALRCDGKDRPIGNNRTQVCVKSSPTVLDITLKENGAKTRATHVELSTDGKVLTSTVTEFGPNGPIITHQASFSRLSGSGNFTGQWRDTSYLRQHADMTLRLDSRVMHISYPTGGQYIDAPLDGLDAPVHGPNPEGLTYAARLAGRRELVYLTKRNGKVVTRGSLKLSNDGTTIIDSWWNPDRPDDKATLVYEKQWPA
jgi:hypothetical protein